MRRVSIAGLMALVLVCGVAVAALKNASDAWAGVLLLLTLMMLGISLLGVLHRQEGKRAFWQGFAIFGWGYLVLTTAPWFDDEVGPRLPTTQLLSYAHEKLNPEQGGATQWLDMISTINQPPNPPKPVLWSSLAGYATTTNGAGQSFVFRLVSSNVEQFVRVGQCLFTLLVALMGAAIARWFHQTNRIETT